MTKPDHDRPTVAPRPGRDGPYGIDRPARRGGLGALLRWLRELLRRR